VSGQNENNARCGGGGRTAKNAKYTNGNSVSIFAWFVWFAVESGGAGDFCGADYYKYFAPAGAAESK
jgi:hypothetical protein